MTKELERDLGLLSVMAVSIGAMIGSGIFILPGLALDMAGPAVVLAYLLAGLLVLPAALSKSELATAMPEAGGTYLYIERGMGPMLGTIAGVGTWFSLSFKGALALVGGAPYLVLLLDLPAKPVALAVGAVLIAVNVVGAKQTGRLQVGIVVAMLAALTWFAAGSASSIDTVNFQGFLAEGWVGVLQATGFVFVSYAGVTKVASVAEEVENPDRNIPLGMLGSLAFTTMLYVVLVVVMVGVVPAAELAGSNVPMALAAENTLATAGLLAVVAAALIALVSTANAGVLSSSRYPFAMSRDGLAPPSLADVSSRFGTPTNAITLTGAALLFMVAFVPIEDIAKLASAFQILVFVLVNVAVIAFRTADIEQYEPSFRSPLYPVPQLVGIFGGLALIPVMGAVPLAGAVVITLGSVAWYYLYAVPRGDVEREGAATSAIRSKLGERAVEETESAVEESQPYDVMVAVTEDIDEATEENLFRVGRALARARDGTLYVTRFDEVPDVVPLDTARDTSTPGDLSFEERMERRVADSDVPVEYEEVVSHDTKHAVVNHAKRLYVDAILMQRRGELLHASVFGSDVRWIKRHAPCDFVELEDRGLEDVDEITVVSDRGPYDASKVMIAEALAVEADAEVELLYAVDPGVAERGKQEIEDYLDDVAAQLDGEVSTRMLESDDAPRALARAADESDLLVISAGEGGMLDAVFGRPSDRIVEGIDSSAIVVYAGSTRPNAVRRFLENRVF